MEEEYQKRIEAVRRYYSGQRANYIYKSLCKPKQWLYFWLKRYNPKDENGIRINQSQTKLSIIRSTRR